MAFLHDIVTEINSSIDANFCIENVELRGITELIERDGKTFPAEICDGRAHEVLPTRNGLVIWHAIRGYGQADVEGGRGSDRQYRFEAAMTVYAIGPFGQIRDDCIDSQLDLALDLQDAMPSELTTTGDNLRWVDLVLGDFELNRSAILRSQFDGFDDLNALRVTALGIDYTIVGNYCKCE